MCDNLVKMIKLPLILEWVLLHLARLLAWRTVQLPVIVLWLTGQLVGGGGVIVVLGRRIPDADGDADDDDAADDADADDGWRVVNL